MSEVAHMPLPSGHVAIVDSADMPLLEQYRWSALADKKARTVYVRTNVYCKSARGRQRGVMLHRLLMDAPAGMFVDHINGDGLDNRRANLRVCTKSENNHNRRPTFRAEITSKYKGVHFDKGMKRRKRWMSQIHGGTQTACGKSKQTYLGHYLTEIEAARAYDTAAKQFFGPFARINFPDQEITSSLHVHSHAEGLSECAVSHSETAKRLSE